MHGVLHDHLPCMPVQHPPPPSSGAFARTAPPPRVTMDPHIRLPGHRAFSAAQPSAPEAAACPRYSVLDALYATPTPETIAVGSPEWARVWKGQLYADDLAGAAAPASGLHAVIDVVRARLGHSHGLQQWGRTLALRAVGTMSCSALRPPVATIINQYT